MSGTWGSLNMVWVSAHMSELALFVLTSGFRHRDLCCWVSHEFLGRKMPSTELFLSLLCVVSDISLRLTDQEDDHQVEVISGNAYKPCVAGMM